MIASFIERNSGYRWGILGLVAGLIVAISTNTSLGQMSAITISPDVPSELNPPFLESAPGIVTGGASNATPDQAAAFAWQEFIALNWPADFAKKGHRGFPDTNLQFGDPRYVGPTVWQTFRGKVEIFPGKGQGAPPGYPGTGPSDPSYGFDYPPTYNYANAVTACDASQDKDTTPWINLDETDQITLDHMYAGVGPSSSPDNSEPQEIRFMAKANLEEYQYVALNKWWDSVPDAIVAATRDFLAKNRLSPPANGSEYVSLPFGTIEIKAAWRPLNPSETASGRFHTRVVRFYQHVAGGGARMCYRDATWGLVALHIIQKTPSAPYFIYASFEQADNLLTEDGNPVEDVDGNVLSPAPLTARTPQVCLIDSSPQPPTLRPPIPDKPSVMGQVVLTDDPLTCVPNQQQTAACSPGKRLYYKNEAAPPYGNICVNKRDNDIPQYAVDENKAAHAAITAYLQKNNIPSTPWLYYKLINVQYYPYDKNIVVPSPNGSLYDSSPPYSAKNPARSSYYMANIVVETNRALQLFSGGLSPNISTDWNEDRSEHKNTYYGGNFYSAGGCLGCHGSQGQIPGRPHSTYEVGNLQAGDFSVILARGHVDSPEGTAPPHTAAAAAAAAEGAAAPAPPEIYIRNRSLE